ncbi:hypothetical protein EXU57_05680 [Segetibacter sp. 3557_3]|uniref:hypothetical protein n=1 Tax=Segetibacter sp. 3557_3 TaxID=2547429 RepID=UPI0010583C87|nr:hypothetical protein [Segetibacter sp. 3557_3]TDH27954.1 hypothetical protein EXU57_05680 [Segetibacter sp. 3557_3]
MDKKKGLADMQDGEFVLNESGTSVSISAESENVETSEDMESKSANAADQQEEHTLKSSSGPEEKDITD